MQGDSLFSGVGYANVSIWEQMQERYGSGDVAIDSAWSRFFSQIDSSLAISATHQPAFDDIRVRNLIDAYRTYGHLFANINPIAIHEVAEPWQLQLATWGLSEVLLDTVFPTLGVLEKPTAPLREIIAALRQTYCNKIGIEYMGVQSLALEQWLQQQIEPTRCCIHLSLDEKQMILQHLNRSELFELFLHTKYTGQKRFSLEGGETLIPMLAFILEKGALLGMREFVLGMAHRGRLNVLSNILKKSYTDIFTEFEEWYIPNSIEGGGDVKYHKGFSSTVHTQAGIPVSILLSPNPSHLEAVDPVVEGIVRARQVVRGNGQPLFEEVVPILIHGDAALTGQGVIYETLQFYRLQGYSTGGTIHIAINNQIGFTTLPSDGRSTRYCTDIARAFGAPVFHVNAEDLEGSIYAICLAVELRQKFRCDVFIDLNCYRKYGHNESDEPAYTQPLEYQIIRQKKPIREIYRDELIEQGIVERHVAEALEAEFKQELQRALEQKEALQPSSTCMMVEEKQLRAATLQIDSTETAVGYDTIYLLAERFCSIPEGFAIHRKLKNLLEERLEMVKRVNGKETTRLIDWGMGEMLAYATLLEEGTAVRISGQDCCRGTFSHRHALWMDQQREYTYFPLRHLSAGQASFDIFNSPLSEYAVLGFEYGYSLSAAETLVIWEAQFGDFCNGAQVIIDQFIATGEQKWGQKSNLTLFLPHGYEGQGPEHSSARMERFLSLAAKDNITVANPSNPAQLFHLLRRQVKQPYKRPLIVFTPKGLLRHPLCVSSLDGFTQGCFKNIIDDPENDGSATTVALCSGRIYYELLYERNKRQNIHTALIRLEQLYPFPSDLLVEIMNRYRHATRVVWVQEEPSNMGAWDFIRPLISLLLNNLSIEYIGRTRSASSAAGSYAIHKQELTAILNAVYSSS